MRKPLLTTAVILIGGFIPSGIAHAQQIPAASAASVADAAQQDKELPTQKDKSSYAVGMSIGNNIKKQAVDVDLATLMRGIKDTLAGKPLLSDEQAVAALNIMGQEAQKKLGDTNMKDGAEFLAANKTKDGVVTLPSGLQYKIMTTGTGAKPGSGDTVVCNYRGTLIDGSEFDSSYKRGMPATFPVSGVIKGWTEALQLMNTGSKWQLFIPPDLAYGARGAGGVIGPNATLVFEVELISIQGK